MPTLESIVDRLWLLVILGHAVLFMHMVRTRLYRTYPFFSAYVLVRVVRSVVLEIGPLLRPGRGPYSGGNFYAKVWMTTEPLFWILYVLVVLELCNLVFRKYKGIASLGRWVVLGGLVVAVIASSVSLSADLSNTTEQFPVLRFFFAISRGVYSSLVIFLLCITGFLSWCPVPVNRNVLVHSMAFAVYFLVTALALLLRNITGAGITEYASIAMMLASAGCLGVWIAALNPKGERASVRVHQQWHAEREQHVMDQLAAINSTLMRATRK